MKKYQLGALTVSDKGLQDTKEMYNHFHYWKMNLEIEIGRERETAGGFGGD